MVKTEWAEIIIPEIDFEVRKQTGLITTIEGIIDRAIEGLTEAAAKLTEKVLDPDSVLKMTEFVASMVELKEMKTPFTFVSESFNLVTILTS